MPAQPAWFHRLDEILALLRSIADSSYFFQAKDVFIDEKDLRTDAHRWETTLHKTRRMRGGGLRNPVFDGQSSNR